MELEAGDHGLLAKRTDRWPPPPSHTSARNRPSRHRVPEGSACRPCAARSFADGPTLNVIHVPIPTPGGPSRTRDHLPERRFGHRVARNRVPVPTATHPALTARENPHPIHSRIRSPYGWIFLRAQTMLPSLKLNFLVYSQGQATVATHVPTPAITPPKTMSIPKKSQSPRCSLVSIMAFFEFTGETLTKTSAPAANKPASASSRHSVQSLLSRNPMRLPE